MRTVIEYISSGSPGLMLVEKDARYARTLVPDALAQMPGAPRPFLEWTMAAGWKAAIAQSQGLIESGLNPSEPSAPKDGIYPDLNMVPATAIQEFRAWLAGRKAGAAHPFSRGILVLQDMYSDDMFHPFMVRAVAEAIDAITRVHGMIIFVSPVPVGMDSPVRTVLSVVTAETSPWLRYGRLAQGFARQIKTDDTATINTIARTLEGLTLSDAEMVVRLTLIEKTAAEGKGNAWINDQILSKLSSIVKDRLESIKKPV